MGRSGRRVLYISYDGALEPLGDSQVVAYLERLADRASITLLTFEKPADLGDRERVDRMRRRLEQAGIAWIAKRYHKKPPVLSTVFDILTGCLAARRWARISADRGLVHARGYVPALIALEAKRLSGARFLFDMRGFWVDEKVEAGHWPSGGVLYRIGKRCERRFIEAADAVVSLTHAGVAELPGLGRLRPDVPVVVIPTCADLDRFRPGAPDDRLRAELGLGGAIVIGCVGTLSNWYLREETLAYVGWLTRRIDGAKVLVVTRDDHEALRADAIRHGVPAERLVLTQAPFERMPDLIRLMSLGVFFIRASFSKRASAATKLAEFLGCGVPVVINDGVGDSGSVVRTARVGAVLVDLKPEAFEQSAGMVAALLQDPAAPARCRAVAEQQFSLTEGVQSYAALYERL